MSDFNRLWVKKYEPKNLSDLILSEESRRFLVSIKDEIPNLLFVGPPGIGKTSSARIIIEDVLKCQYLYINASDENGIDVIRTKIVNFAQTRSIDGGIKIIVLDESDRLTRDAQDCLRNIIEEYAEYTRFILTANYKHKITTPIQSRFQCVDLVPPIQEILNRIKTIIINEQIKVSPEQRPNLVSLIKNCYPDIRKTINTLQRFSISGEFVLSKVSDLDSLSEKIHECIRSKKVTELRKYLIENESSFFGDYSSLLKSYLNYVFNSTETDDVKSTVSITIAEHLYKDAIVIDKEINAFACFCALQKSI